jgi:hypothetical protein
MKHLGRFMGYEQKYYLYVHNSRSFAVFSKPSMSWPAFKIPLGILRCTGISSAYTRTEMCVCTCSFLYKTII